MLQIFKGRLLFVEYQSLLFQTCNGRFLEAKAHGSLQQSNAHFALFDEVSYDDDVHSRVFTASTL